MKNIKPISELKPFYKSQGFKNYREFCKSVREKRAYRNSLISVESAYKTGTERLIQTKTPPGVKYLSRVIAGRYSKISSSRPARVFYSTIITSDTIRYSGRYRKLEYNNVSVYLIGKKLIVSTIFRGREQRQVLPVWFDRNTSVVADASLFRENLVAIEYRKNLCILRDIKTGKKDSVAIFDNGFWYHAKTLKLAIAEKERQEQIF